MSFSLLSQDKDLEICAVHLKLEQLEAELQDLNSQESKDEASLAKVKKQLRDLEAKVKDQEEELDEQAGTIQMLEQVIKHTYTITFFLSFLNSTKVCDNFFFTLYL